MPFPPSAACRFFDLPPVNLQNLPLHLTKNSFASAPTHLCGIALVPFLSQEEVTDISVLDPISAHVELIEGNNVLRKATAQQFQIHDILQNEIDVPHIAAKDRLADAVVGNIILLIGGKDLFALQVLPLYLIEQVKREDLI